MITPKPGKFNARAEKGWFVGFQKNTNKNFIIYYPRWTPSHGWKWVETYTPHATFNEEIMFGDELSPIERQKNINYWTDSNLFRDNFASTLIPEPLTHASSGGEQSPYFSQNQEIPADEAISTQSQPRGEHLTTTTSPPYVTDLQPYKSDDFTENESQIIDSVYQEETESIVAPQEEDQGEPASIVEPNEQ